jgi:putative thiamine transport system ATP-binding protein
MALMLKDVTISLDGARLIGPLGLAAGPSEIVCIMGASGSGKSSLLAYIAGDLPLPLVGSGAVVLNNVAVNGIAPERRKIGRLFQDDLLFPHMTVRENLLFGLPRGPKAAREAEAAQALADAELDGFGHRAPHTLSGGQRSRIALFRALLARPDAMLLDEPFSKLDDDLKGTMRNYVYSHLKARGIPALMVTHDRADAPPGGRVLKIGKGGEVRDA